MDAADYKNYVFPVLFWKWISDNWELEHQKFLDDYAGQDLGEEALAEVEADYHIFTVPDGTRWSQVFRNEGVPKGIQEDKNNKPNPATYLGIRVKHAMDRISQANTDRLANIFGDVHYANQERLPEAALKGLLKPFDEVSLDRENAPGDLMGAAYEYLLKRFADDAGQKAGEFFAPRSVVHLVTRLLKPQENETIFGQRSESWTRKKKYQETLSQSGNKNLARLWALRGDDAKHGGVSDVCKRIFEFGFME